MTPLAAFGLIVLTALPVSLRQELRDREMPNQSMAARKAATVEGGTGFAVACSKLIEVKRGMVCETIHNDDLSHAQARLGLRSSSEKAYIDGDFFTPLDGRTPQLVTWSLSVAPSHVHHCPVVSSPHYGPFFVESNNRLCSHVSQEQSTSYAEVLKHWVTFYWVITIIQALTSSN